MGIEQWSQTAGSNVNANTGINWDEGMAPSAVNDSARSTLAAVREWYDDAEWIKLGENGSATAFSISFVSTTMFKFAGVDRRTLAPIDRRIKAGVGAGVIYGTVTASSLSASDTQITVKWDSGSLDASLSFVSVASLNSSNRSFPDSIARLSQLRGFISGLTYSNNVADATNDIDIAVGCAMDGTNAKLLTLGSAITKQLDAAWAVGTNAGGLDTGSIGNSDYYIWLIARSDTGVVDALYSLSSTAPTMPANYDYKRLIGWFKRVGGTIVAFTTYETEGGGLELMWSTPTLDVNLAATLTTSRRTDAVKVPLNFSVIALLSITLTDASSGFAAIVECPDHADVAVGSNSPEVGNIGSIATTAPMQTERWVRTSATGTIAARSSLATIDSYQVSTYGFRWARR